MSAREEDPDVSGKPVVDKDADDYFSGIAGGLIDVRNSAALKNLKELRDTDKIAKDKFETLEAKFLEIYNFALASHQQEHFLLQKIRAENQVLTQNKYELDRIVSEKYDENSYIGELRRELIRAQNELTLGEKRREQIASDMEAANKQRIRMQREINQLEQRRADMFEPQFHAIRKSIDEMKLDVIQRKHQLENLKRDLEEKEVSYNEVLEERDKLSMEKEKHISLLAKATELPIKLSKQSSVLQSAIDNLHQESIRQTSLSLQVERGIERLNLKKKDTEDEKVEIAVSIERTRSEIGSADRHLDALFKENELSKDQVSTQRGEMIKLDMNLRKVTHEIKREHEVLLRNLREKETMVKTYRRLENAVSNTLNAIPGLRNISVETARALQQARHGSRSQKEMLRNLRRDIDVFTYSFLKEEKHESKEKGSLQVLTDANSKLDSDLDKYIENEQSQEHRFRTLCVERDQRARDLLRVQNKFKRLIEDVRTKDLAIIDNTKSHTEALARLREFAGLYDVVKNERNKYVNLIQATTQRSAEMKEKIRILMDEVQILRNEIVLKDRELLIQAQRNSTSYAIRDSLRTETNKQVCVYRERRELIDQQLGSIEKLNAILNLAESDMIVLRQQYEGAIKSRNNVGLHLLDRNDELCLLYERLNQQESILEGGEISLSDKEEELRLLRMTEKELMRELEAIKRAIPRATSLEEQIIHLKMELMDAEYRVGDLTKELESPTNPERWRDLGGADPTHSELVGKVSELEQRLSEIDEKLLEKDLILEEVATLSARMRINAISGRRESVEVAKQAKIKEATRDLMATVSELSMNQALVLSTAQMRAEREMQVNDAERNIFAGLPPSPEVEAELERELRVKQRRQMDVAYKKESILYGTAEDRSIGFHQTLGIRTTALVRPNAYIADGILQIPKPYGAMAPFKPQMQGAQMRHIRKPMLKEIEI